MVRPSRIARKARREHERQQALLQKHNLPLCQGCESCTATEARAKQKLSRGGGQERTQSERSRIRQGLKITLFEGVIIIHPREIALTEAALEGLNLTEHSKAVYWADGSRLKNGSCGIGVVYSATKSSWTELSYRVRGSANANVLEVYAISKALEIAWKEARDMEIEQRPSDVCIYSDSQNALHYFQGFQHSLNGIKRLPDGERLVGPSIMATHELVALGIVVELRYVPGHSGIEGNSRADRAARKGTRYAAKQRVAGVMIELVNSGHDH
ncbi:ribonuclease H-like domain-containing protein [Leptodontidium sp. MPI-SDFR-AT-0119]|nr:ribonuclease H-like domain-containing protein [Leptodontidium sp. MPI-SDFR-AT-0119]